MKFWFRTKVKDKIIEIIQKSSIENHSNYFLRSIPDFANLPAHVDFHLLLADSYFECLGDYIEYLYRGKRFNELQAAIFVITKVFQTQSEKPNAHQELRKLNKMGELMSDGSIKLFVMAKLFLDESPEMFKPVFNYPDPSIYDDIERATGLKEYNGTFIAHDESPTIKNPSTKEDMKRGANKDISYEDHIQRFEEESEALYNSDPYD